VSAPVAPLVQSLIKKVDNLKIVRDQIAAILLANSDAQQAFALVEGENPDLWKLRVYIEQTDCRGEFTSRDEGDDDVVTDPTPVVSVWLDKVSYDKKRSSQSRHQQADAIYHIDIYGCGVSHETSEGQAVGSTFATEEVIRAYGLVRNILMSDVCINLGMPGVVGDRWPDVLQMLGPSADDRDKPKVERVAVGRLTLSVSFLEFSPQYEAELLETIGGSILRKETGEIYFKTNPQIGV
jgi:hypothetical protein